MDEIAPPPSRFLRRKTTACPVRIRSVGLDMTRRIAPKNALPACEDHVFTKLDNPNPG